MLKRWGQKWDYKSSVKELSPSSAAQVTTYADFQRGTHNLDLSHVYIMCVPLKVCSGSVELYSFVGDVSWKVSHV